MWVCYFGEISESYRENWKPHTVRPDQESPSVFDVLAWRCEIMYRLDSKAADRCFSDQIQVDWGGWAYRFTKTQAVAYNEIADCHYLIPQSTIEGMEEDKLYGIIDVEVY